MKLYMDVMESVLLPPYSVWTASMSYLSGRYEIMATVNNLTDEKYYTSADLFDSVVVKPSEGRAVSVDFELQILKGSSRWHAQRLGNDTLLFLKK